MNANESTEPTEILITSDGVPKLRALFDRYAAKAVRFGLAAPEMVDYGCVAWCKGEKTGDIIQLHRVAVSGMKPRVSGYSLVAKLHYLQGSDTPVVFAPSGEDVPARYRGALPVCDHCGTARRRADTFVIRSEAGETIQVGRNCLADFMPEAQASAVLAWFEFTDEMGEIARAHVPGEGSDRSGTELLSDWLGLVAIVMRVEGCYRSSQGERSTKSTASYLDSLRYAIKKTAEEKEWFKAHNYACPTDEDRATVNAAVAWASELGDDCDNYLANLRAIARRGLTDNATRALATSMIAAHHRAMGRIPAATPSAPSAHQGTVGQRLTVDLTVLRAFEREGDYGVSTFYILADAAGNSYTWSASGAGKMDRGETYHVTGTVKAHGDYQGTAQTVLTRCKVAPLGCGLVP